MKLFVDTGNIKDIEALAALGIIDGVTTNPSLLAKEPGDFRQNLKRICEIVKGPVSGEVTCRPTLPACCSRATTSRRSITTWSSRCR